MDIKQYSEIFMKYSIAIFLIQKVIFLIVIFLLHTNIIKYNWEKIVLMSVLVILALIPL